MLFDYNLNGLLNFNSERGSMSDVSCALLTNNFVFCLFRKIPHVFMYHRVSLVCIRPISIAQILLVDLCIFIVDYYRFISNYMCILMINVIRFCYVFNIDYVLNYR